MRAAGPLGTLVRAGYDGLQLAPGCDWGTANSLILLNRVVFPYDAGGLHASGQPVLQWAAGTGLGQEPALVAAAAARRRQALAALSGQGYSVTRLTAAPQWRLVVGLGSPAAPGQPGIARHGTYGWPLVPGQALKGLAAAWASRAGAEPGAVQRILGLPRASAAPPAGAGEVSGSAGTVRFLDALPVHEPSVVTTDVIVPHSKPYYDADGAPVPPAEYNQPVPMAFLAVARARFAIDLIGRNARDTSLAAEWCTAALAEEGAGAKTAAGYGAITATLTDPGEQSP